MTHDNCRCLLIEQNDAELADRLVKQDTEMRARGRPPCYRQGAFCGLACSLLEHHEGDCEFIGPLDRDAYAFAARFRPSAYFVRHGWLDAAREER